MTAGYSKRNAVKYSSLVFNILKDNLLNFKPVETPIGTLYRAKETRSKQRRWNYISNRPETVYKHPFRIILVPNKDDLFNE